ncbi:Rpn family recombination-promoting nuclease/putative transposase, partial [Spirochaeta dissipatitropha]
MEHRPHDSIFRAYFSDAGSMTELLHLALPSETFDRLNASSLQVEPDTYLDDEGSRH